MIRDVVQWLRAIREAKPEKQWLVIGKGPTSDKLPEVNLSSFVTVTLNHACKLLHSDLAHFTDLEALDQCERVLASKNYNVVMPWHPHIGMKPAMPTLLNFATPGTTIHRPMLSWSLGNDQLFSYNSTVAQKLSRNPKLSTVRVRYFSAVAAFNMLADAGVKTIYTIGVDGGTGYGSAFADLKPLENGRESFDAQAQEFALTCKATGCMHIDLGKAIKTDSALAETKEA